MAEHNYWLSRRLCLAIAGAAGLLGPLTSAAQIKVTRLAGNKSPGWADGKGAAARFCVPEGLDADSAGNVYLADMGNNRVRRITPAGLVSTLAGGTPVDCGSMRDGGYGHADGPPMAAQFYIPSDVAVDPKGNVYVADSFNRRLRKIAAGTGQVSTLAGGEEPTDDFIFGVAVHKSGTVYFTSNSSVYKVSPQGEVSLLAGAGKSDTVSYVNGRGAAVRFHSPTCLVVSESGTVYVADKGNGCIRAISPDGTVSTLVGNAPPATPGKRADFSYEFDGIADMALSRQGMLYMLPSNCNCIHTVDTRTGIAGVPPEFESRDGKNWFWDAAGIAVDAHGSVYVSDSRQNCLWVLSPAAARPGRLPK